MPSLAEEPSKYPHGVIMPAGSCVCPNVRTTSADHVEPTRRRPENGRGRFGRPRAVLRAVLPSSTGGLGGCCSAVL